MHKLLFSIHISYKKPLWVYAAVLTCVCFFCRERQISPSLLWWVCVGGLSGTWPPQSASMVVWAVTMVTRLIVHTNKWINALSNRYWYLGPLKTNAAHWFQTLKVHFLHIKPFFFTKKEVFLILCFQQIELWNNTEERVKIKTGILEILKREA